MKRLLRPAFLVTAAIASAGCADAIRTHNPPEPIETKNPPGPELSPDEKAAYRAKYGIHPRDNDHHLIFKKSDGSCYVQVDKAEPPPKELMSGEKWVEDRAVSCPAEFDDPAFAAIGDQEYWILDKTTNECFISRAYGNPPPADVRQPCPPVVKKLFPAGASEPPIPVPPAPPPSK